MSVLGWRFGAESDPTIEGMTYLWDGISSSPSIRAGVIGDAASVVTINAIWTPTTTSPSPFLGYGYSINGSGIKVITFDLSTSPYAYGEAGYYTDGGAVYVPGIAADGLLELTATVDGVDASNTLIIACFNSSGAYGEASFGYGVGAPSFRWTNIRQAEET